MEKKLVSILIPVYNRVNLVGETIESAIKQTYKNTEIIICDNCSTDGTWELLQKYSGKDSRIRLFRNDENIGPVRNWKRCIDEAKGEYSKILFSDDLIESNFIEETIKNFDEHTAFVISKIKFFNEASEKVVSKFNRKKIFRSVDFFEDILLNYSYKFPISPAGALFRTVDLRKSLLIDIPNTLNLDFERFGAGNDLLLFLNTAILYPYIRMTDETTAHFREHIDSFTISNRLSVYYDFSRYYFMTLYYPSYLLKFKTILWLRIKRTKQYTPVLNLIEGRINVIYLFQYVTHKMINLILKRH